MATTRKIPHSDVTHYPGEKIQLPALPKPMSNRDAITVLQLDMERLDKMTSIVDEFPAFPWDGAIATEKALKQVFGYAIAEPNEHAKLVPVAISPTETIRVPWGTFILPGLPGGACISTGINDKNNFTLTAYTRLRDQPQIEDFFTVVRHLLATESVYRSKAIEFKAGRHNLFGTSLPEITFLPEVRTTAIFSSFLEDAIESYIYTPMRYTAATIRSGAPLKRGILLAGKYGTGKTLLAANIAREATRNGWTYIYVADPDELIDALKVAKLFQPCVVFVEDVDRVIGSDRSDEVNAAINEIDGVGTKDLKLMLVMTTNYETRINPAMLREGRTDLKLVITAPDSPAVARLIKSFAIGSLNGNADVTPVAALLAGQIPATIREVVERSKLNALCRTKGESSNITLTDLETSAHMLLAEKIAFTPIVDDIHPLERIGRGIAHRLAMVTERNATLSHLRADVVEGIEEGTLKP